MITDVLGINFSSFFSGGVVVKAFFILFLVFYIVFALIIFRQTQLMGKTLPTIISPFLKFISILNLGIAVAFLFVVLGVF
ncbi:MAG TPA: DUF5657 family protein [Candidatus Saccharimonadales bacterium]|nr:DUF5657 family protein [Candidatus Saccharimonadales bacterium]